MGYSVYKHEEITLRDQLAIDRTDLANSRTFLVYIKTALLLLLSGFTVLKLEGTTYRTVCLLMFCVGASGFMLWYGYIKYDYYKKELIKISVSNHREKMKDELKEKLINYNA